jgi:hypothetical protein
MNLQFKIESQYQQLQFDLRIWIWNNSRYTLESHDRTYNHASSVFAEKVLPKWLVLVDSTGCWHANY